MTSGAGARIWVRARMEKDIIDGWGNEGLGMGAVVIMDVCPSGIFGREGRTKLLDWGVFVGIVDITKTLYMDLKLLKRIEGAV